MTLYDWTGTKGVNLLVITNMTSYLQLDALLAALSITRYDCVTLYGNVIREMLVADLQIAARVE